jgi:ATP-binding cassette subfamily D (ALD) protein 4
MIESFDKVYGQEWNKLLSPGEQQRLVFGRILYWKPRFAGKVQREVRALKAQI